MTLKEDPFLLDHVWSLFCALEDSAEPSVVEAAYYLVNTYNFDVRGLPETLYESVMREGQQQSEDSYWDDEAKEIFMERFAVRREG